MKKVTSLVDYFAHLKELEEKGQSVESLGKLFVLLTTSHTEEYKNKKFAVPVHNNEYVAVVTPDNPFGLYDELSEADFSVSVMTIAHFNRIFLLDEIYIVSN